MITVLWARSSQSASGFPHWITTAGLSLLKACKGLRAGNLRWNLQKIAIPISISLANATFIVRSMWAFSSASSLCCSWYWSIFLDGQQKIEQIDIIVVDIVVDMVDVVDIVDIADVVHVVDVVNIVDDVDDVVVAVVALVAIVDVVDVVVVVVVVVRSLSLSLCWYWSCFYFYYYDDDYYYYYYYYCHLSSIYHQFVLLLWVSLDPSHNWEDWLCHWGLTLPRMSCSAWGGDSTWPALDQHVDIWSKNLWIPLKCPTFLYISPVWIPGFSFQWLFLWQTEEWSVWWDLDREDQAASWISRYVQVKMMDLSSRHVHHTMWFSPYFDL